MTFKEVIDSHLYKLKGNKMTDEYPIVHKLKQTVIDRIKKQQANNLSHKNTIAMIDKLVFIFNANQSNPSVYIAGNYYYKTNDFIMIDNIPKTYYVTNVAEFKRYLNPTLNINKDQLYKEAFTFTGYLDYLGNNKIIIDGASYSFQSEAFQYLEESEVDKIYWSSLTPTNINHLQEFKDSLIARYAMFDRPKNGLSNVIIDNYAPKWFVATNFMKNSDITRRIINNIPSTAVAISPWFAYLFGVKQLETEQMCRIIGYTLNDIKKLIAEVKKKKLNMCFVGYGGTNVNTIKWLADLAQATHQIGIFKNVTIYEEDDLELSNLLRFPKNHHTELTNDNIYLINSSTPNNKLMMITKFEETMLASDNFIPMQEYHTIEPNRLYLIGSWKPKGHYPTHYRFNNEIVVDSNTIIYGAPGLAYREELSKYGHFIAAIHASDSCQMYLNPSQDLNLQVESYGLIALTSFFMNQFRMAIGLLETLANPEFNPMEKDKQLLSYSFDGQCKLATDRSYNFNLEHSGLVSTEETANVW